MCIAIPGKIKEIESDYAKIDYGGIMKSANIRLCPSVEVGDSVLIHAGFVIQVLDEQSAKEFQDAFDEIKF